MVSFGVNIKLMEQKERLRYLDNYCRELKAFLQYGYTETNKRAQPELNLRELTDHERMQLLTEIVLVEQEMRIIAYHTEPVKEFTERLHNDCDEMAVRCEMIRGWSKDSKKPI